MGQVILEGLHLRNFKGIRDLDVRFGQITDIHGANATGKTTIFDAFTWLLFDKDSTDRKDFTVKTTGIDGQVLHGLEHMVAAEIRVDGKEIILQKTYREKWTKRRGEADKTMTGHETEFTVNGVPMKKSDYEIEVQKIVPEALFKLITNPLYFGSVLPWKDRREMLLEVVGNVSDYDVLALNPKLSKLSEILDGHTIPDFRAMITAQKRKINDELSVIPARIDETSRQIPEIKIDFTALEKREVEIKGQLSEIDEAIASGSSVFGQYRKTEEEIIRRRVELRTSEAEISADATAPLKELRRQLTDAESELANVQHKVRNVAADMDESERIQQSVEREVTALRSRWNEENAKTFEFLESGTCPTCGQSLPADQLESKRQKLEDRWKAEKQKSLQEITSTGKAKSELLEREKRHFAELEGDYLVLTGLVKALPGNVEELQKEVDSFIVQSPTENAEYKKLELEIKEMENALQKPYSDHLDGLRDKKAEMQQLLDDIRNQLSRRDLITQAYKRVDELSVREKELANLLAKLEGQEKLTEDFIRTKVDLLELKINEKFKIVRFKMFRELVNGALDECCEVLIDGVPYQDANNAAKINGGIDIINTLTGYHEVSAPIFVDNRESVVDLIQTDSQVVNLIVSAVDSKLRVEVQ